ncbi:MAG: hypothetical protein COB35_06765 [Gammaproteobacteria bacterium]|nr:MAG: hypothetical protein COB35_06765 [Gammaproteobacteria bacterium]
MTCFGLTTVVIKQIQQVFEQYPEIDKVILYGSRAKGNYRNGSDVDLTLQGAKINLDILNRLSTELDDLLLPYTIDLSIYNHIDNKDLIQHIEKVGRVFYRGTLKESSSSNVLVGDL